MGENETPPTSETPAGQTETKVEPSTPPLTVEAIRDALLPEVRKELKAAYDAARRAEAKAERAPEKFRESIRPIEEAVEALLTKDMTDDARAAFTAKRDLVRERQTQQDPDAVYQKEVASFQQEVSSVLEEEGIKSDDPILVAAYQKYLAGAQTPAQWRTALGRSVAAVHKDRATKSEVGSAEREKKAREDERTKVLNERRGDSGPIDRGQPASSGTKKDWANISAEQFKRADAGKDAERKAHRMAVR